MIGDIKKTITEVGKWIQGNQGVFVVMFACAISAEVYLFPTSADTRLFFGLVAYWFLSVIGKLPGIRVLQLSLALLFVMTVSYLYSGAGIETERLAVWFILFFAMGVVTQWRETLS